MKALASAPVVNRTLTSSNMKIANPLRDPRVSA
jgi:hypothetical protein